jgi:hypothetical protein
MRSLRLAVASLVPAALVACGLEVTGLQDTPSDGGMVPTLDSGGGGGLLDSAGPPPAKDDATGPIVVRESGTDDDAKSPPPPPPQGSCDGSAGCYVLPTGWSLIALAPNQSAPCPTGFAVAAPNDIVESPSGSGACTCGACSVAAAPICTNGAIIGAYDVNNPVGPNTCGTPGSTMNNNPPGGCDTDVYTGNFDALDLKFTPPPPSDGQCASPGQATGAVSYGAEDRACQPDSPQAAGCSGDACTPNVAAPYAACIVHGGTLGCPAGTPFSVLHVVGTGATVDCTACNCAITADCSGSVEFFTDTACMNGELDIAADDGCHPGAPLSAVPTTFGSYKYVANAPTNVACNSSGASTGTATLTHEQTICCLP